MTPKQRKFAEELVFRTFFNAAAAARAAGVSKTSAREMGHRWLRNPEVQAYVAELREQVQEQHQATLADILQHLQRVVSADPRELIEHRRVNCRHCWGRDFRHQHTRAEWDSAVSRSEAAAKRKNLPFEMPDEQGGSDFDRTRPPHPDCPECRGEGVQEAFIHDTRELSEAAALLYRGVKVTKDGIQVLMADQQEALKDIIRILGGFKDRVEHSGPDGKPIQIEGAGISNLLARLKAMPGNADSPGDS